MSDKLLYLHPHLQPDTPVLDRLSDDELLSLAVDGELDADEDAAWARVCSAADAHSTWQSHLAIGNALRVEAQPARGQRSQSQWMAGLRQELAKEQVHRVRSETTPPAQPTAAIKPQAAPRAANDSFWKLVAGGSAFTSLAAVAVAVAVTMQAPSSSANFVQTRAAPPSGLAFTREAANSEQLAAQPVAQWVQTSQGQEVMLRDARMLEKMAQHRMLGSAGVHASNAFVRHAAFDQAR